MGEAMQAVRVHAFGGPEVLQYEEVPVPDPAPGEVLVQVHAAGVNPPDWYARTGALNIPAELRPVIPLPFTPGTDVSGVVAAVGEGVDRWRVGDDVLGLLRFPTAIGAGRGYAEYTTAPAGDLAAKPAGLDHLHAAALPMAGLTAHQLAVDYVPIQPGSTVLVNGAAGGVGHFLVQFAKQAGCQVITVASGRHETFLRGLGADEFIDYTLTSVAETVPGTIDHLFDTVGGEFGYRLTPAIRDGGLLSPVFLGEYHQGDLDARRIRRRSGQVHSDGDQLAELAGQLESGRLQVQLDSVFPLADAAAAHARAERGHIQGKIVLAVAE
jgi:NADPH:quinone reductase-like Zn-dependent oxidoreductase